ncbi:NAD-dependent isocitrate dehydrogenase (plasmid) [Lichenicola cladoniae]|uniref:NAD-dependent isocitrate dehydrogenase n=1 Tax=Lichenicola cladoniae TaxID=1484109 RepID=A0A6M8HY92_9PROT|nr:isocitrate/isopropylmalate family dehydrogenase [Lichenicola cladoniae]NPD68679.1 NAD-dependent isocitrate dehydrogenase [Acetobacteraceae bacterium]QKE93061.1 NAD-dependent isocitrate dehydrogenase [Lichenicola cladoniae]
MNETSERHANVVLIPGDGIGPEISDAVIGILDAAGARIDWVRCEAGGEVFKRGDASGVPAETVEAIRRCGVALKSPLATPLGRGERSANVTLREKLKTFAAVRPVRTLAGIRSPAAHVDLVLIRENYEDLYIGMEYDLGEGVLAALKVNSERNTRTICRTAFDIARSQRRRHVTGISKSNILKKTDGMFDRIFDEEAARAHGIESGKLLVDAAACRLVQTPERFDVIVTSNLYGDILSDLTAGLAGGLGLAASVNLGRGVAMFEAVHGSAPDIAGRGTANPTALLRAAVLMLDHLGLHDAAGRIEAALALVFGEGRVRTADLGGSASTSEFARAIVEALERAEPDADRLRWSASASEHDPVESQLPDDLRNYVAGVLSRGI